MRMPISIIVLVIILTAGCPLVKAMAQDTKPLVAYVQNLELAKVILMPPRRELLITRDPFKPLITPASKIKPKPKPRPNLAALHKKVVVKPQDLLKDVQVIGIVRLDQEYRAYITVGKKARVVNLQDTVRKYTIISMDMDQVVFKSGKKVIIKQRGKL